MVPARPHVLRKMLTPQRYRDADYAVTVAAELYGGRMRERPDEVRRLMHDQSRVGSRRGYLLQLEHEGILSPLQREIVIDRLVALDSDDIDIDRLKWLVLMVLSSQPGQEQACARMEHLVLEDIDALPN